MKMAALIILGAVIGTVLAIIVSVLAMDSGETLPEDKEDENE